MEDPKPVYKNGVLIGYTYDNKNMIPVKQGAKEVFKDDKLIGITYDGENMESLSSSIPKKKEQSEPSSIPSSEVQSPTQSLYQQEVAKAQAAPKSSDLTNKINQYIDQVTPLYAGWGATPFQEPNKAAKDAIATGDIKGINDIQDKVISYYQTLKNNVNGTSDRFGGVKYSPAAQAQLDDYDKKIEEAKADFYMLKGNSIVQKWLSPQQSISGAPTVKPMDYSEIGREMEQAGLNKSDFLKREKYSSNPVKQATPVVATNNGKVDTTPPLPSDQVDFTSSGNRLTTQDVNPTFYNESKLYQNINYEREKTGIDAVKNYLSGNANDLKLKILTSDNPQQYKDQFQQTIEQYDKADNSEKTILQRHPDVWIQQTARLLGDKLSDLYGYRTFYNQDQIDAAANAIEKDNPGFKSYNQEAINQVTTNIIPKAGFLGATGRSIRDIWHNITNGFGFFGSNQAEEMAKSYDTSEYSTSKAGGVPTKIVVGNDGKTYRELPNENYHAVDFNNGMRWLGTAIPHLAEFVLLSKGAGALTEAAAGGLGDVAATLSKTYAGAEGATVTAEDLASIKDAFALSEKGKELSGLIGSMYATSYSGYRQYADQLIEGDSSKDEANKNLLAHAMTMLSVASFEAMGTSPTQAVESAWGKVIMPEALKYINREGIENLAKDGINEGWFRQVVLPKTQALLNSVQQGAKLGTSMVLDNNVRGLLAKAINPEVGKLPSAKDDVDTMIEQMGLMTIVGAPGWALSTKNQMRDDALYHAGLRSPQFIDRINQGIDNGEYGKEQGSALISFIKTLGEEANKSQNLKTSNGLDLTTKQKRDVTILNTKARMQKFLEQNGNQNADAEAAKTEADNYVNNITPKYQEVTTAANQDGSLEIRPLTQEEIDSRWKSNVASIDARTDINDEKKQELKQQEDLNHTNETKSLMLSEQANKDQQVSSDTQLIQDAINNNTLKGANVDQAKAALSTDGGTDMFLQDIASQALNKAGDTLFTPESAMNRAKEMYGEDLVNKAVEKFPEETKPVSNEVDVNKPIVEKNNAAVFYSPNESENLTFDQAQSNLKTKEHAAFREMSDNVDKSLGIDMKHEDAIGDWSDGAENSVFAQTDKAPDFETLKYSAAVKGLMSDQKAVIPFIEEGGGKDLLVTVETNKSPEEIRKDLDENGLQFRTLVPTENGTKVVLFDSGGENLEKILNFAEPYKDKTQVYEGKGEFFGADTREESRNVFQQFINGYEESHPDRKGLSSNYERGKYQERISGISAEQKVETPEASSTTPAEDKNLQSINSARQSVKDFAKKFLSADTPEGTQSAGLTLDKVIDAVFDTIEAAYKAGKAIKEAIEEGINKLRGEDAFKNLKPDQQKQIEDFISQEAEKKQNASTSTGDETNAEENFDEYTPDGTASTDDAKYANQTVIDIQKKALSERVQKDLTFTKEWKKTFENAENRIVAGAKRSYRSLFDQMEAIVMNLYNKGFDKFGKVKKDINPSDEDLAIISMYMGELDYRINSLKGWESGDFNPRSAEDASKIEELEAKRIKAERALRPDVAGRSFGFRQAIYKIRDGKVEIERKKASIVAGMDIPRTQQEFDNLSEEDKGKVKNIYEAYKAYKDANDKLKAEETKDDKQAPLTDFEKKVQEEVERRLKEKPGARKQKQSTIKERGAKLADTILKLKIKQDPNTLQSNILGVGVAAYNTIIESIAGLVRGGATIIEAIDKLIEDGKIKLPDGVTNKDFEDDLAASATRLQNRGLILDKIKQLSDNEKADTITTSAVKKGIITEFVHSFIDEAQPKEILDLATEALKEKFPDVTREQVADAYLKEGAYKVENSGELKTQFAKSAAELRSITNLQKDVEALKAGKELEKNPKESSRIIGDYEASLKKEKDSLLDERKKAEQQRVEAQRELDRQSRKAESERQRIQKLRKKLSDLQAGIREKTGGKAPKVESPEVQALKETIATVDKELRASEAEIRKADKDAADKNNRLNDLDKKIKDLDEHRKLWDKVKSKKVKVDAELAKKRDQLKEALIRNGKRLERGSVDSREAKQEVIDNHNENIKNIFTDTTNTLNEDLPDDTRSELLDIQKNLFSDGKLRIDDTNEENLSDKINNGVKSLKEFVDNADYKSDEAKQVVKQLKGALEDLQSDNQKALEDIQLSGQVKNLERRKSEAERKLNAGEFDDNVNKVESKKTPEYYDALLKSKLAEAKFRKEQSDYAEKNATFLERLFERIRRTQVANIVSGLYGMGKVFWSAIVKPVSDLFTRNITAPIVHSIGKFLGMDKAIERERLSPKATLKSFYGSYVGMSVEKANSNIAKSETNVADAKTKLNNAYDQLDNIGSRYGISSDEYKKFENNELQQAKNEFKASAAEYLSNVVYQFISPKAWGERWEKFTHGATKFEQSMGDIANLSSWKDEPTVYDKMLYCLEAFARTHGVLKDLSSRQAFLEGYFKRIEKAVEDEEDITPLKLQEIVFRTYQADFLAGKYQEKNVIAEWVRKMQDKGMKEGGAYQVLAFISKSLTPVLKVPLNIEKAGIVKYTFGVPVAGIRTSAEIVKAWKLSKLQENEGKSFLEVLRDHMGKLDPHQADKIYEYASKGLVGLSIAAIAMYGIANGNIVYGGEYEKGKPKRKFLNSEGKWEELGAGELAINGHKVGKFWSKVLTHLPEGMPIILGANYIQTYKDQIGNTTSPKDKTTATLNAANSLLETAWDESALRNIGNVGDYPNTIFTSFTSQMFAKNISEYFDTDKNGDLIERKPLNLGQEVEMRIGLRKFVPTKDEAIKIQTKEKRGRIKESRQTRKEDQYYKKNKP